MAPPDQRMVAEEDGRWHRVEEVQCKTEDREKKVTELKAAGLRLNVAQFHGPGTSDIPMLERATQISEQILKKIIEKNKWVRLPGRNCWDGHGGSNVDLADDN